MDWLARLNAALDLMEKRLEGSLDIQEIAQAAYVSPFHFQRMFHMLTGMTVAEYVRKRKLTVAAQELTSPGSRVVDVALRFGYDSPESFAKAFRRVHGVAPSEARNPGVRLKAFPRISFHLSLKGEKDMDYRIVEMEAFSVAGKLMRLSCRENEHARLIPQFWAASHQDGTVARLSALSSDERLYGIVLDMQPDQETITYMIAAKTAGVARVEGLEVREIPAATWAMFTAVGPVPQAMQCTFQRVFQEWFPATGYEIAPGPELEVYPPGDLTAEDYKCEAWIPIIRK
ncbi:MAG TPA: AraC family transcriptional regulator [Symbiobacteriaceae bacterium]|nr:AraC family transcriptional regulator [Symbiobacteriaceae bacterium]